MKFIQDESEDTEYKTDITATTPQEEFIFEGGDDEDVDDEMYEQAKKLVIESGKASTSFLQRRLRLGYARAARMIDILEERGVVGPGDGAKPRDVLVKNENSYAKGSEEAEFMKEHEDELPPNNV